jgi:hypothetical protein
MCIYPQQRASRYLEVNPAKKLFEVKVEEVQRCRPDEEE